MARAYYLNHKDRGSLEHMKRRLQDLMASIGVDDEDRETTEHPDEGMRKWHEAVKKYGRVGAQELRQPEKRRLVPHREGGALRPAPKKPRS